MDAFSIRATWLISTADFQGKNRPLAQEKEKKQGGKGGGRASSWRKVAEKETATENSKRAQE